MSDIKKEIEQKIDVVKSKKTSIDKELDILYEQLSKLEHLTHIEKLKQYENKFVKIKGKYTSNENYYYVNRVVIKDSRFHVLKLEKLPMKGLALYEDAMTISHRDSITIIPDEEIAQMISERLNSLLRNTTEEFKKKLFSKIK
tara:strand:+ start:887 stop:1315 length:429 start_codon:yes stop_codon:yes gene_type:complete